MTTDELEKAITNAIKTNGEHGITGESLQKILIQIVETLAVSDNLTKQDGNVVIKQGDAVPCASGVIVTADGDLEIGNSSNPKGIFLSDTGKTESTYYLCVIDGELVLNKGKK